MIRRLPRAREGRMIRRLLAVLRYKAAPKTVKPAEIDWFAIARELAHQEEERIRRERESA